MSVTYLLKEQRVVFDGFFRLIEFNVKYRRESDGAGKSSRGLCLERGDSTAVVVLDVERGLVLLARQFRYPAHSSGHAFMVELFAGGVKPGEDPEASARRELEEELGHRVPSLIPISSFYVSPGGSSERIHLFYAEVNSSTRVSAGGGLVEESEDIEIVAISVDDVADMLLGGEFVDAKTIIGLNWLILGGGHRIVRNLAREPVNPSPRCPKCANVDVRTRYCDGCSKRVSSDPCSHGGVEHFHRYCRTCNYDWITYDVIDAVIRCKERT